MKDKKIIKYKIKKIKIKNTKKKIKCFRLYGGCLLIFVLFTFLFAITDMQNHNGGMLKLRNQIENYAYFCKGYI